MKMALSLFPGLGVLDMAFQEAGWCVVRGPDVVWQGDIRGWHVPSGHFDGVFGGPPCQAFSKLAVIKEAKERLRGPDQRAPSSPRHRLNQEFGNLIPEFERCVSEAQPNWYLMENVEGAPLPDVDGYEQFSHMIKDCDVGGETIRERRFTLGLKVWPHFQSPWTALAYHPLRQGFPRCDAGPACLGRRPSEEFWPSL